MESRALDKPSVTPAFTDRLLATESAIQKAIADAAQAMAGARHTLRIAAPVEDEATLAKARLNLAGTRRALAGACWRREATGADRFRGDAEVAQRRLPGRFSWRSTAVS